MTMTDFASRRAHFRIIYPVVERPSFEVGRSVYDVIDISELGMRYEVRDKKMPLVDATISGTVAFRHGGNSKVTGKVLRLDGDMVILILDKPGFSFSGILGEQRYLRSKGYTLRE